LRWRDIDTAARVLTVREAVYDRVISTPKTDAGSRQIPLSETALALIAEWRSRTAGCESDRLVFGTRW